MKIRMRCQEFTFKTASGQLGPDAPAGERLRAALHLMVCASCRRFAHNNAVLDEVLQGWRERKAALDQGDENA